MHCASKARYFKMLFSWYFLLCYCLFSFDHRKQHWVKRKKKQTCVQKHSHDNKRLHNHAVSPVERPFLERLQYWTEVNNAVVPTSFWAAQWFSDPKVPTYFLFMDKNVQKISQTSHTLTKQPSGNYLPRSIRPNIWNLLLTHLLL